MDVHTVFNQQLHKVDSVQNQSVHHGLFQRVHLPDQSIIFINIIIIFIINIINILDFSITISFVVFYLKCHFIICILSLMFAVSL